jgi:hypothetical protein
MRSTRHGAVVVLSDFQCLILQGANCFAIDSHGHFNPAAAWTLLGLGKSNSEIGEELAVAESLITDFCAELDRVGLLVRGGAVIDRVPRDEAIERFRLAAEMWRRHLLFHPLFRVLHDDSESKALFLSFLYNSFHFTRLTPVAGSAAANAARTDLGRRLLLAHFDDESTHHIGLGVALAETLSCDLEAVMCSRPSPLMSVLGGYLHSVAVQESSAYAACLMLLELPAEDADEVRDQFRVLAQRHAMVASERFLEHAMEDAAIGHSRIARQVLAAELPELVPSDVVNRILNAVHDLKHAFESHYDSLVTEWGNPGAQFRLRPGLSLANI